jgi:DNA-binding FadR family transcriptional regulator
VREAIIALEVQGLVEVRIGSGAYVLRIPGSADTPGFNITAFELTEARLLFEGEAAALAALKARDPAAARAAMRLHLSAVLDSLLFATEEKVVAEARRAVQAQRDRYRQPGDISPA